MSRRLVLLILTTFNVGCGVFGIQKPLAWIMRGDKRWTLLLLMDDDRAIRMEMEMEHRSMVRQIMPNGCCQGSPTDVATVYAGHRTRSGGLAGSLSRVVVSGVQEWKRRKRYGLVWGQGRRKWNKRERLEQGDNRRLDFCSYD